MSEYTMSKSNKPSKSVSRFISKKIAKKPKPKSKSIEIKDMKAIKTKDTFCTDMLRYNQTCDVIKKSTKNDDIDTLRCSLCCNEWYYNEPKYECIHCKQVFCGCVVGKYHQKMYASDTAHINDTDLSLPETDSDGMSINNNITSNGYSSNIANKNKKRRFHEMAVDTDKNEENDIQPKKRRKLDHISLVSREDIINIKTKDIDLSVFKRGNEIRDKYIAYLKNENKILRENEKKLWTETQTLRDKGKRMEDIIKQQREKLNGIKVVFGELDGDKNDNDNKWDEVLEGNMRERREDENDDNNDNDTNLWKRCYSDREGKYYWFNTKTGKSQWSNQWRKCYSDKEKRYYWFNQKTGQSKWFNPDSV